MDNLELPDVVKMHRIKSPREISFKLVIVSDSRYREFEEKGTVENDKTTEVVKEQILGKGYKLIEVKYVPDDIIHIRREIMSSVFSTDDKKVDVIITSGGTGITKRDVTIEAIKPLFEKELAGFSTIFHSLSYSDVGAAAIISRATAGVINRKIVFCLPGSPKAVKLALEKIILPEIGLLVKHANE